MKWYQLWLVLAFIVMAPHLPVGFAMGEAIVFFIAAILYWRLEK